MFVYVHSKSIVSSSLHLQCRQSYHYSTLSRSARSGNLGNFMGHPSATKPSRNYSWITPTSLLLSSLAGYCASSWSVKAFWGLLEFCTIGAGEGHVRSRSEFTRLFEEVYYDALKNGAARGGPSRAKFDVNDWKYSSDGGLTESDRVLLGNLYYNASSIFEFGLGESTQIAAHVGVPRFSGIDSDAEWVIQAREKANRAHFRFYFADIGLTREWGMPVDGKQSKIPMNYQLQALYLELEAFDVYLVDGRYRVACTAVSFLHALSRGARIEKTRVLIHDADRDAYQIVLQIADIVDRSDRLVVLQLKQNVAEYELASIWREHAYSADR